MKMYIKVLDKQPSADLSTRLFDVDNLILVLQLAKEGKIKSHEMEIMCDDHHTGSAHRHGGHEMHIGELSFRFQD